MEELKIKSAIVNGNPPVTFASPCLICGELVETSGIGCSVVCDKCKDAVLAMRQQIEAREKFVHKYSNMVKKKK